MDQCHQPALAWPGFGDGEPHAQDGEPPQDREGIGNVDAWPPTADGLGVGIGMVMRPMMINVKRGENVEEIKPPTTGPKQACPDAKRGLAAPATEKGQGIKHKSEADRPADPRLAPG